MKLYRKGEVKTDVDVRRHSFAICGVHLFSYEIKRTKDKAAMLDNIIKEDSIWVIVTMKLHSPHDKEDDAI